MVVLKEKHEALWDAVMEVYKVQLPADKFEQTKGKMEGFRKAYGTVSGEDLVRALAVESTLTQPNADPLLRGQLQREGIPGEVQDVRG